LWHLSSLKEELEKSKSDVENIKDYLSEIKTTTSNIEKEMDWWSDKNSPTLAKQIIKRLDAIEYK